MRKEIKLCILDLKVQIHMGCLLLKDKQRNKDKDRYKDKLIYLNLVTKGLQGLLMKGKQPPIHLLGSLLGNLLLIHIKGL